MISIYFSPPIASTLTHGLHSSPLIPSLTVTSDHPPPPITNTLYDTFVIYLSLYACSYSPARMKFYNYAAHLPSSSPRSLSPKTVVNQDLPATTHPLLTLLSGAVCTSLGEAPQERNSSLDFYFAVGRDADEAQTPNNSRPPRLPRQPADVDELVAQHLVTC